MNLTTQDDGRKWINAFLAISCVILGFVVIRFSYQLGEWFDLEAKINHYLLVAQGAGVFVALSVFLIALKKRVVMDYLAEVYAELVKVVWPDNDSVVKLTVGIVIALCIVSAILVSIDFIFSKLLDLIY